MKTIVAGSRSRKPRFQKSVAERSHQLDEAFDSETLDELAKIDEVRIVTRTADGKKHRVTIWMVVVDGAVFVRSFTGSNGRWYKDIVANPIAELEVAGKTIHCKGRPDQGANANPESQRGISRKVSLQSLCQAYDTT